MKDTNIVQFKIFCDYLAARRVALLAAWRKASEADPRQTTARSLTRAQFNLKTAVDPVFEAEK